MKYSKLFGKTRKTVSKDTVSVNHKLLMQAGFVDQLSAGVFTWLPLGLRVLRKIDQIIREEMDAIGGQEVVMPALIQKSSWEQTGRWDGVDVLFKTKSQTGKEYGLGFSHEEVVTPLAAQYIQSYKDLPHFIYQIQNKFRDELRAKSGLLRGREFGMKDLYSFHADEKDLLRYYNKVTDAYLKIFRRMGLNQIKITEASGGTFTRKNSHEFNVMTPAGEVDLLTCENCTFAQNTEVAIAKPGEVCPKCGKSKLKMGKAIEVGNIFDLGKKFTEDFKVYFTDKAGHRLPVIMGCYGIGDTRLVGTIVELFHDDRGIIWPKEVAPYDTHLISLAGGESLAEEVYQRLVAHDIAVLWDERVVSAGRKFADCDLIGIPIRLVISQKTGNKVEVKLRDETGGKLVDVPTLIKVIFNK